MTTTHPVTGTTVAPVAAGDAATALQRLVQLDAGVAAASGAALMAAAGPLSDLAGVPSTTPSRIVGAFLLLLAVDLVWLGTTSHGNRLRWVPASAAGDLAWAVASVAVAALADLTGPGRALIVVQGLAVLAIGEAKLLLHRRARPRS